MSTDPNQNDLSESVFSDSDDSTSLSRRQERKQMKLQKRFNTEKDIRYRGPLSYRWFRIFAWLCVASGVVYLLLNLGTTLSGDPNLFGALPKVLEYAKGLSLPFFLIATYAVILNHQGNYLKPLVRYAACSAAVIAVYLFAYEHYLLGLATVFMGTRTAAVDALQYLFSLISKGHGFFSFNIFIDLFLCTLFMFMLNYRSARKPGGVLEKIVRILSIVPILYEVASIVLKIVSSLGLLTLPLWSFPLLTTKPPMTFVAFLAMAIFINRRESKLKKLGLTDEEYDRFMKSNRNSLHFSLFAALVMLIAGTIDLIIAIFSTVSVSAHGSEVQTALQKVLSWGVGGASDLIFLAPLMLLFSYTRTHKNRLVDTVIPIAGIALILIIITEGVFQGTMALKDAFPKAIEIISILFQGFIEVLHSIFG